MVVVGVGDLTPRARGVLTASVMPGLGGRGTCASPGTSHQHILPWYPCGLCGPLVLCQPLIFKTLSNVYFVFKLYSLGGSYIVG